VVVGRRVFVGSTDGVLYALDLDTGKERWRFETGSSITASPAVADGCLVIGTLDGEVYCFGAATAPKNTGKKSEADGGR
jgi:outer membrane protein assembly factor BamB